MKARFQLLASAIFAVAVLGQPAVAQLPTGAQVVHGNVAIAQAGVAMNIQQASQHAIVNWQSFNIGAGNAVNIQQPGSLAAMLARVNGGDASQLLGSLKADGKLFLINQRGIVVGENAVIDTAGFLGSTLDVTDAEFLAGGAMTFKGSSDAAIVNLGKITAREGNVMLFAHSVKNGGEITAGNGTVGLGAGTEVLFASPHADGFVIKTNLATTAESIGVDNSGVIAAAQAQLEAAGGSIYELAVNQSGVVRATGSVVKNGRVLLTADGGTVGVSGEISAQNANGSGGEILVGGDFRGQNADVANAARTVVTQTATLDASATSDAASAGRVIVWADGATRFLGSLKATGAGGGFAEVSGKRWLDFNPAANVQLGRNGTLLLDPDALIISNAADSGATTSGTDPFTFSVSWEVDDIFDFDVPPPSILNVATLQDQLAVSNVILDTSTAFGDVTFDSPVTWSNDNTLTVRSGNSININADITGGAESALELYTGIRAWGAGELGFPSIDGDATLAEDATIKVGTLVYGGNEFAQYPEEAYTPEGDTPSTGVFFIGGNLDVNTLQVDLSAGDVGLTTSGANNTIRNFHATGDGVLSAYVVNHNGDLDLTFDSTRSSSNYVQFFTPGNLTLTSGSAFDFERPEDPEWGGNLVLASTDGGTFINDAGANVFGDNTRFLIYTSTTSATNKGGLTAPEILNVFNHPYDEDDDFDDDVSRFFFTALSGAPVLTYKADSFSRNYGAANSPFTFTREGLLDDVADDVTGTPSLSSSATQSSGVGAYAISIGLGTLASSNYDFDFVAGTLTIERAPLTVTANDKTRRVNLANPDFDATFAGFVLDQDASVLGGTLTFTTPADETSPNGTYAITPAGLTSANYQISFVPGTLTLNDLSSLLIRADSVTRTYGAENPDFTASYIGLVGGDTESVITGLQYSTTATQSSGIGHYTITPFGASAEGYEISYETGTLTIDRAPLTISIPNQSRLYGDENDFTINYNGLVNGETRAVVSGLSVSSSATTSSSVGSYAISASGAAADNYSISYSLGSLSVTPAPLTVSIDPATRHYGDPDPVFTYSITGLKNDDSESLVTVHNLASLASANAGIGAYGIVGFPFVSSSNYTVATQVSGTLTITPRPLAIRANDMTRVYGDANPTFTATFDGLVSFDTPELFGDLRLTTQATESSGVGNWGIVFSTVTNPNYTITSQFGTLTITPAPLTLLPLVELSRVYGRANPSMPLPEVGGLKNPDTVAGLGLAFETPAPTADAGLYTYRLTTINPNYSLETATGEFRVTPAPITVAIGPSARVYGDANPTSYDIRANGLAFGQAAASVIGVNNPTETKTDIGTYAVTPTLLTPNYMIESFTGGAFTINPRPLTLIAHNASRPYGSIEGLYTGTATGFAEGDSELNILTNFGFTPLASITSPVGTYVLRPSAQTTTSNYYVHAIVNATLTITPAVARVVIDNVSRPYGQENPAFTAAVQGLRNQETVAALGLTYFTAAASSSARGSYAIDATSSNPNYAVTIIPGSLLIGRGVATISGGTVNRPYGDALGNPFTPTFTGLLPSDEALARSNWELGFTDAATLAPGPHEALFTEANSSVRSILAEHYDITVVPGTLNVTPRRVTIAAPDFAGVVGSPVPSFEVAAQLLPGAPAYTVTTRADLTATTTGSFAIIPEVVPADGVTRAELDAYYDFALVPGALTLRPNNDVVDLTQPLDPSRLNQFNGPNQINTDFTPTNETIEVEEKETLTIAANPHVDYSTEPLTHAQYAAYFGSYLAESEALRLSMDSVYQKILSGKGKKDSQYENMTPAARELLSRWMDGSLAPDALQALIADGDASALDVFSLILPSVVERTRDKSLEAMTPLDRQVLGRLADLTEKRRTDTLRIAEQKYAAMLEENARRAELGGFANILVGPGDFKNIVEGASQEALTAYIGATVGAAVGTTAAFATVLSISKVLFAIFPAVQPYTLPAIASAGPAIAVANMVVLAVRAVQVGESIQNEKDFNALMNSWKVGQEITSIEQLKSGAMDQDMKLSTMMLSVELFKGTP